MHQRLIPQCFCRDCAIARKPCSGTVSGPVSALPARFAALEKGADPLPRLLRFPAVHQCRNGAVYHRIGDFRAQILRLRACVPTAQPGNGIAADQIAGRAARPEDTGLTRRVRPPCPAAAGLRSAECRAQRELLPDQVLQAAEGPDWPCWSSGNRAAAWRTGRSGGGH